jgi:hypothetical protein
MLLEIYGFLFNGCYWKLMCFFQLDFLKFMDFYLVDVTGNLWNCFWMVLEIYGFVKWMLLEIYGNVYGCYWKFMEIYFQKSTLQDDMDVTNDFTFKRCTLYHLVSLSHPRKFGCSAAI